jgi:hypothetical protein
VGQVVPVLLRHAELLVAEHGEPNGLRSMRRHGQWYLQGYPVGGDLRRRLGLVETLDELTAIVGELDPALRHEPGATALPRGHTEGPRPVSLPEGWLDLVDDPTPPVGAELLVSGG